MRTAILLAAGLALVGCNTVEGFGRDLSATGGAISSAAREAAGDTKPAKTAHKSTLASKKPAACSESAHNKGQC